MEENACATLWTNQMGYITLIDWLPWIYGNVNHPCPWATPSDSGWFTAINPGHLGNNYYIILVHIYNVIKNCCFTFPGDHWDTATWR